jgi:hypothetical protein
MERLYSDEGRSKLLPTTASFNLVLNCIASSTPPSFCDVSPGVQAEDLLRRMDRLCSTVQSRSRVADADAGSAANNGCPCQPDNKTFNLVLKCYVTSAGQDPNRRGKSRRSRRASAPERAEEILQHMERRYEANVTTIRPDAAAYNTVLTAWARLAAAAAASVSASAASASYATKLRKVSNVVKRAERLLERMETHDPDRARPNALSYNIVIHALAQEQRALCSNDNRSGAHNSDGHDAPVPAKASATTGDPAKRALDLLSRMKRLSFEEGRRDCSPDVYTFTGVCDALAKVATLEASSKAENLLKELEQLYEASRGDGGSDQGSQALKPNIQLYTSVRSRLRPETIVCANTHALSHFPCVVRSFMRSLGRGQSRSEPRESFNGWSRSVWTTAAYFPM